MTATVQRPLEIGHVGILLGIYPRVRPEDLQVIDHELHLGRRGEMELRDRTEAVVNSQRVKANKMHGRRVLATVHTGSYGACHGGPHQLKLVGLQPVRHRIDFL